MAWGESFNQLDCELLACPLQCSACPPDRGLTCPRFSGPAWFGQAPYWTHSDYLGRFKEELMLAPPPACGGWAEVSPITQR